MQEENLERPNYYAVLTAQVRYSKIISSSAKLLYAEITALSNSNGTCWASNKYFAELYEVSGETVSRWVTELVKAGFVTTKINKAYGNRRYIKPIGLPIDEKINSYPQKAQLNNTKDNSKHVVLEKELLILVNKVTHRAFRTLPNKGVKKLLGTFTLVEISSALTALAADDWHAERLKELSLDYMIRPTTIDKFLSQAVDSGDAGILYVNGVSTGMTKEEYTAKMKIENKESARAIREGIKTEYDGAKASGTLDMFRQQYWGGDNGAK